MDVIISLLVFAALPHVVQLNDVNVAKHKPVITMLTDSRIFSSEKIRLNCSFPQSTSTWRYKWFKENETLAQESVELYIWGAKWKDSGKYYCQGVRDSVVGTIHTYKSLPVEIDVEGGWVILQTPPNPNLVGETVKMTCRIRGNPRLQEVFLYKDDIEVLRQHGSNTHFVLPTITLNDQGKYSCRATWDISTRTHSAISKAVHVSVEEVLPEPILELIKTSHKEMKLICHCKYNARAPAPAISFYFYKDGQQLGRSSSQNYIYYRLKAGGWYTCKAKVPQLDLVRWSKRSSLGEPVLPVVHVSSSHHRKTVEMSHDVFELLPAAEGPFGKSMMNTLRPTRDTLSTFLQGPELHLPTEGIQRDSQTALPEVDMSGDSSE